MSELLTHPPYWLLIGLEWPSLQSSMAEGAYVIAPPSVPRHLLTRDVAEVLGVADLYAERHPAQRVVWFTDLTRWLDSKATSWAALNVDWEHALHELPDTPVPGLYLTISQRAHGMVCDASRQGIVFHYLDGSSEQVTPEERDRVHEALESKIVEDWPVYILQLQAEGKLLTN